MDEWLRLFDDARAEERSASRGRERLMRQAAEDSARMAGTLVDLAERGSVVSVRTAAGRSHHGPVRLVGSDFCVLAADAGDVWLALSAVTTVRPHPAERHAPASGDRSAVDLMLIEALARIASERPRLTVVVGGGEAVSGRLVSVGEDVLTFRLDGDPRSVCYVSGPAVREVLRSG